MLPISKGFNGSGQIPNGGGHKRKDCRSHF